MTTWCTTNTNAYLMIPGMDGLTPIRNIRESGNRIPIIIVRALDTVSGPVKILETGSVSWYRDLNFSRHQRKCCVSASYTDNKPKKTSNNMLVFLTVNQN